MWICSEFAWICLYQLSSYLLEEAWFLRFVGWQEWFWIGWTCKSLLFAAANFPVSSSLLCCNGRGYYVPSLVGYQYLYMPFEIESSNLLLLFFIFQSYAPVNVVEQTPKSNCSFHQQFSSCLFCTECVSWIHGIMDNANAWVMLIAWLRNAS